MKELRMNSEKFQELMERRIDAFEMTNSKPHINSLLCEDNTIRAQIQRFMQEC